MAPLYRSFLPLFVVLNIGLEIAFFVTKNGAWEWGVGAIFELSLLACILFIFSSFDKGKEIFGVRVSEALLLAAPSAIICSDLAFLAFSRVGGSWKETLIKCAFYLVCVGVGSRILYTAKSVLIEGLSDQQKTAVVDKVFNVGYGVVFPPVIYVGAEVYGCVFRYDEAIVPDVCGGLYPGAKALCLHLVATLFVDVAFLNRHQDMTRDKIMTMDVNFVQFVQCILFAICGLLTLSLYGTRHSGPFTRIQAIQLYTFYGLWSALICLEGSMKLRKRLLTVWRRTASTAGGGGGGGVVGGVVGGGTEKRKLTLRWANSMAWKRWSKSGEDEEQEAEEEGDGIGLVQSEEARAKRTADLRSWNIMGLLVAKKGGGGEGGGARGQTGTSEPVIRLNGAAGAGSSKQPKLFEAMNSASSAASGVGAGKGGAHAGRDPRRQQMAVERVGGWGGGEGDAAIGSLAPGFL